jgi:hypothetical protein
VRCGISWRQSDPSRPPPQLMRSMASQHSPHCKHCESKSIKAHSGRVKPQRSQLRNLDRERMIGSPLGGFAFPESRALNLRSICHSISKRSKTLLHWASRLHLCRHHALTRSQPRCTQSCHAALMPRVRCTHATCTLHSAMHLSCMPRCAHATLRSCIACHAALVPATLHSCTPHSSALHLRSCTLHSALDPHSCTLTSPQCMAATSLTHFLTHALTDQPVHI